MQVRNIVWLRIRARATARVKGDRLYNEYGGKMETSRMEVAHHV